jgi:hypothetical protein
MHNFSSLLTMPMKHALIYECRTNNQSMPHLTTTRHTFRKTQWVPPITESDGEDDDSELGKKRKVEPTLNVEPL